MVNARRRSKRGNKYKVKTGKNEAEEDLGDAKDKVKAGAKALAGKIKDPDKDLETEYEKEKIKEKLD